MKQNTLYNAKLKSEEAAVSESPTPVSQPASPEEQSPLSPVSFPGSPVSENLDDSKYSYLHPLVKKKSGELVKSSLKLHSLFSSRSLPATPTYKQVHFGVNIDVKYFKKKDRPTSISAENSPDNSDNEEDSGTYSSSSGSGSDSSGSSDDEDEQALALSSRNRDYYAIFHALYLTARDFVENFNAKNLTRFKHLISPWDLDLSQFPKVSYIDEIDREVPIFLESCHLNPDKTVISGQIAVKNVSYSKNVTVRYTFDDWTTVINIDADYTKNIPRVLKKAGYDRFSFQISVPMMLSQYLGSHKYSADMTPTFSCCFRYVSGGHEFWDNNFNRNYIMRFVPRREMQSISNVPPPTEQRNDFKKPKQDGLKKSRSFENSKQIVGGTAGSTPVKAYVSPSISNSEYNGSPFLYNSSAPGIDSPGTPAILRNTRDSATGIRDNFSNLSPRSMMSLDRDEPFTSLSLDSSPRAGGAATRQAREPRQPPQTPLVLNGPQPEYPPPPPSIQKENLPDNGLETSPDAESKPAVNSKSYQDLLEKYCFFKSPSTVSSFLESDPPENHRMLNNDDHSFY
ncbi:DEKNAAC103301 [Brettanomyces naardenensis]|uniref:DEKNAAC103301 n=1 Tax=Brettanomyces naardenensis TaxID=13370 RepID=A0A448YN19_BRENA|nr:DEKNAAC103301 [Brettanomyces naardenensis]